MSLAIFLGLMGNRKLADVEIKPIVIIAVWCLIFDVLILVALFRLGA